VVDEVANRFLRHTIPQCEGILRTTMANKPPDLSHLGGQQFGIARSSPSALLIHVSHVVCLRSWMQVNGIETRGMVTGMPNDWGGKAVDGLENETMHIPAPSFMPGDAITVSGGCLVKDPTVVHHKMYFVSVRVSSRLEQYPPQLLHFQVCLQVSWFVEWVPRETMP
jgi:hypothetical protein